MEQLTKDTAFLMNTGAVVAMLVIFYFLILRPQKKNEQQRDHFRANLKRNDKVITIGGIYGVVTALTDVKATLRVAEKVEIEFSRSSIARYQDATKQELAEAEAKEKK